MLFQSQSADLSVSQQHTNSDAQSSEASSDDGEIVLKYEVQKPVTQYVNEVITPKRLLTQKVLPVKELIKTIVTKDAKGH